ncbi:hypothetical protein B7802_28080 [Salmonella enterica]|nr:hypothetical protein [Salmonella enterica]
MALRFHSPFLYLFRAYCVPFCYLNTFMPLPLPAVGQLTPAGAPSQAPPNPLARFRANATV